MIGIESRNYTTDEMRASVQKLQADPFVRAATDAFTKAWYDAPHTWAMTYWQGVPTLKCPMDLWSLQDIIVGLKPSLIIETGTAFGGSALFYGHLLDLNGKGSVLSIDIDPPAADTLPNHTRVTFVKGSSVHPQVVDFVANAVASAAPHGPIFVLLDSDHSQAHVARELETYERFVGVDGLLLVEDTNINGHPVLPNYGPGPHEAVEGFLAVHPEWHREICYERYILTCHPGGWLRRYA